MVPDEKASTIFPSLNIGLHTQVALNTGDGVH
jgi:hypothetical protein